MNSLTCENCGSNELNRIGGHIECQYCRSRFSDSQPGIPSQGQTIDAGTDIDRLLAKCREDPKNRRRYANLILDIDPHNTEAIFYLR